MQQGNDIGVAMDVRVGVRVATVGSRGLAQLIDVVFLTILQALLFGFGLAVLAAMKRLDDTEPGWWIAGVFVLATIIPAIWFVGYEIAWNGQTPGKRWIGLRVVTDDGRTPEPGAILVRNLMRFVDFLPGAYFVGLVAMVASDRGKRLGDIVAGTIVIAEDRAPAAARRWPDGIADAEVRLLEAYFSREATLPPERREALAGRLLARLGRPPAPGVSAEQALADLCPLVP